MSWASDQVDRYHELQPLYEAFAERLHDLLEELVEDEGIGLRHSYPWARDSESYDDVLYRALREGRTLGERLEDVGDVAGVALVVSTPAQVDAVAAIVERELAIDYSVSLPPAAARETNERNFSSEEPAPRYEHVTYLVSLNDDRGRLREWSPYAELRLEVHVLTYSQYAWWTTETRHLQYHWAASYPPAAREAFARAAALFAAADEALASEEASRESVDERYVEAIAAGQLDFPLDARALAVYLTRFGLLDELVARARAAGMKPDDKPGTEASNWFLEQTLLWLLGRFRVATVEELDHFLDDAAPRAPEIFRRITELSAERGYVPIAEPEFLVLLLLVVLNRADADTIHLLERRSELEAALNVVIGNPLPPELEDDEGA